MLPVSRAGKTNRTRPFFTPPPLLASGRGISPLPPRYATLCALKPRGLVHAIHARAICHPDLVSEVQLLLVAAASSIAGVAGEEVAPPAEKRSPANAAMPAMTTHNRLFTLSSSSIGSRQVPPRPPRGRRKRSGQPMRTGWPVGIPGNRQWQASRGLGQKSPGPERPSPLGLR